MAVISAKLSPRATKPLCRLTRLCGSVRRSVPPVRVRGVAAGVVVPCPTVCVGDQLRRRRRRGETERTRPATLNSGGGGGGGGGGGSLVFCTRTVSRQGREGGRQAVAASRKVRPPVRRPVLAGLDGYMALGRRRVSRTSDAVAVWSAVTC